MLRVRRGRDKPLAIFEPFGSKPNFVATRRRLSIDATEEYLLSNLAKVDAARRESGLKWDYYGIEFWHDPAGRSCDAECPQLSEWIRQGSCGKSRGRG